MGPTRSKLFTGVLATVCLSACVAAPPEETESPETLGVQRSAVESYFCVDHPCPDLVPVKYGECVRVFAGPTMRIGVRNTGTSSSGPSQLRFQVPFVKHTAYYNVPGLAAGAAPIDVFVTLPSACQVSPGCYWTVKVDATNTNTEISGDNNTAAGACLVN